MYDLLQAGGLSQNGHHLHAITRSLQQLEKQDVFTSFKLPPDADLLKTTISVCPHCMIHVPASVYSLEGRVFMKKHCSSHGYSETVLENDQRFYSLSNKDFSGKCYAPDKLVTFPVNSSCCSDNSCQSPDLATTQLHNTSCTVLVEITNQCNISCRLCYSDANGNLSMPFATFRSYIEQLIVQKHEIDSIQLTGGEAVLHPQFWEILDWLYHKQGIKRIYLPTNGIEFMKNNNISRLRAYRKRILVLLQFDGHTDQTNFLLRRSQSLKLKYRFIHQLHRHRINMQLTMALAHNLSEKEISSVVRLGMKYNNIRVIGMLPAFYTGRVDIPQDPLQRLTLSDVIKGIIDGTGKRLSVDDFHTIPCSHPNCGWTTLFAQRFGLIANISRYIDSRQSMQTAANKTLLDQQEMRSIIGTRPTGIFMRFLIRVARRLIRSQDVFGIAIKPFMDMYTYDHDRAANCCHHILNTKGQLRSFCEYNVLERSTDDWSIYGNSK